MVLRIGGWMFTYDQVRTWLERGGRKYEILEYYELSGALKEWFEERQIRYMAPIPTDYPRGSKQPVILLTTRYYVDPAATVMHYTRFVERAVDRKVKRQVLEETGFKDDDLRWVTVIDPYFHDPVMFRYPRNYALWPETGAPPEEEEAENKGDGDNEVEKRAKEDGDKKEQTSSGTHNSVGVQTEVSITSGTMVL
ncbi:hypothetical protein SCP_0412850 [Sparassis crispa]|uniref:Uncharacterized protein n=1 Tax=Sparassis crispa TaxID=139825 RepID=A0A401GL51_9APHY|nr:hypothetical protein SCP_0412850 [Sparassis crispa]GBE82898.1 hypothetical protein SCP_0412850 [Sparassis crispa]